jgi:hypothetical protein
VTTLMVFPWRSGNRKFDKTILQASSSLSTKTRLIFRDFMDGVLNIDMMGKSNVASV